VTQITSVDAVLLPTAGATKDATNPAPTRAGSVAQSTAQPAVIVSLGGTASPSQQLPELNPDEVNRTLASLGAANGFAWAYEHIDWDALTSQFGAEKAGEDKEMALRAVSGSASYAGSLLAKSPALPVHQVANPDATKDEVSKVSFTVSNFSFTCQGSVYSITHAKKGLLIGTKDGQGWGSWQVTALPSSASGSDAGAAIALDTLTSTTPSRNPGSAAEIPNRIDVTA
jgi:hypothetical protein